jgi:two-component system, cell cycle response regulator
MTIELSKYTRIPSLPTVALEVLKIFQDPNSSLDQIVAIVRNDPAIVGKLLKAANSTTYTTRGEITDLKRAVVMLGRSSVTPLVLSFSLAQQSVGASLHSEYYRQFWLRSFVQATTAEVLGAQFGSPTFRGECYTTNLLAGIGKLALFRAEPDRYLKCLQRWQSGGASLLRIEQEDLGFTHVELSGELLKQLGLPSRCVRAIQLLDSDVTPTAADSNEQESLIQISRVAHALASLMCDKTPGVAIVALEEALSNLKLPNSLSSEELLGLVQDRVEATARLFDLDPPQLPSPSEMLQEALEQLSTFAVVANAPDQEKPVPIELMEENGRLKRRVADLLQASRTDSLTGVFNRAHFLTQLAERVAVHRVRHQSLGLAVVDIDHFKKINDTHGHQAGDYVLKLVAESLQHGLRDTDLLARYGGEEFVILMEDSNASGLPVVGERLRARIESLAIQFEGKSIPVTISVGLSESPVICEESEFARQLFAAADAGMYRAKHSGRNQFCIEPFMADSMSSASSDFSARLTRTQMAAR